jgi:hypothetical protein
LSYPRNLTPLESPTGSLSAGEGSYFLLINDGEAICMTRQRQTRRIGARFVHSARRGYALRARVWRIALCVGFTGKLLLD